MFLAFLCNAMEKETLENGEERNVMKIHPALSAYKAAVLPLSKNAQRKMQRKYMPSSLSTSWSITMKLAASASVTAVRMKLARQFV